MKNGLKYKFKSYIHLHIPATGVRTPVSSPCGVEKWLSHRPHKSEIGGSNPPPRTQLKTHTATFVNSEFSAVGQHIFLPRKRSQVRILHFAFNCVLFICLVKLMRKTLGRNNALDWVFESPTKRHSRTLIEDP